MAVILPVSTLKLSVTGTYADLTYAMGKCCLIILAFF